MQSLINKLATYLTYLVPSMYSFMIADEWMDECMDGWVVGMDEMDGQMGG